MRRIWSVRAHRRLVPVCLLVLGAAVLAAPQAFSAPVARVNPAHHAVSADGPAWPSGDWPTWQKDLAGSRFAAGETTITPGTVAQLTLKWAFTFPRIPGVFPGSQPAVARNTLYVGGTDAKFYALNARTAAVRWVFDLTQVAGPATDASPDPVRDGPAVGLGTVYFGDSRGYMFALDRWTGQLRWATLLDAVNPDVQITSSPLVFDGRVYVGVSNKEAGFQLQNLGYPCCTARGEVVALNAFTGAVVWRHYTVPPAQAVGTWPSGATEYAPSGVSVWSSPVIDPVSRTIYVGTGQNYTGSAGEFDSLLALDLDTGHARWEYQAGPDTYTDICNVPQLVAFCPGAATGTAHDWDFSDAGNLFWADGREMLGIGAKSGIYRVFDALTGELIWARALSPNPNVPGGTAGIQWGTSSDGHRLYVATWFAQPGTLYALDPGTGAILWQTSGPADGCTTGGAATSGGFCALAFTPAVTTSPGLVYEGSADGKMYIFSASTGRLLWQFDTVREFSGAGGVTGHGESISGLGGAVVAGGMMYVQSGYYPLFASPEGTVLLAFGLPDDQP